MKKNKLYPDEPYIETCYGNTALWIRSLALHPKRCIPSRPDKDMSKHEEKCYDKIINAAISEAKEGDLRMCLTGFEHSPLIDEWLVFNAPKIVRGIYHSYLEW